MKKGLQFIFFCLISLQLFAQNDTIKIGQLLISKPESKSNLSWEQIIKNKYLPFSYLSVGLIPSKASAFRCGCFVGRSMEKNNIKVETETIDIDKEIISERVKKDF
jgi:hypothetical protein